MEVILNEDLPKLGYKNDLVNVKPGYARNYLIPRGIANLATDSKKKEREENIKQAAHKEEKIRKEAEATAKQLESEEVVISTKVGEKGRIFGAVTTLQIADALSNKGYNIDRKRISIKENIKETGEYPVHIDLHREVKQEIQIKVVPEE